MPAFSVYEIDPRTSFGEVKRFFRPLFWMPNLLLFWVVLYKCQVYFCFGLFCTNAKSTFVLGCFVQMQNLLLFWVVLYKCKWRSDQYLSKLSIRVNLVATKIMKGNSNSWTSSKLHWFPKSENNTGKIKVFWKQFNMFVFPFHQKLQAESFCWIQWRSKHWLWCLQVFIR